MLTRSIEMSARPTRDELLSLLKKLKSGDLPIEKFVIEFDELGKLGVSSAISGEQERRLFSELWRFVDAYTPHYQKPTTVGGVVRSLIQQFKGESEVGADAVRSKAAELQHVMCVLQGGGA